MIPTDTHQADTSAWSLSQWLGYIESIHSSAIDLGLERVRQVAQRLDLSFDQRRVITVAGTNGKGTTCAMIEQGLMLAGEKVAVYSSPHLLDYRERVRVNGQWCDEQAHCDAFAAIEAARGEVSLSYFEFGTLAALYLIDQLKVDTAILEVGLGGRLDAVNIIDADIGVITTIDIDHQDWLGSDRNGIGREKAGILRPHQQMVIGELDPPPSIEQAVNTLHGSAQWQGKDFHVQRQGGRWDYVSEDCHFDDLPEPAIPLQNAATALTVLRLCLPDLTTQQARQIIQDTHLPGRFQEIDQRPRVIVDVAHNPQATGLLWQQLQQRHSGRLHLVVGMLGDKDSRASLAPFLVSQPSWYLADLSVPRGAKAEQLKEVLVGQQSVLCYPSVEQAYQAARSEAAPDDTIVVFGSFFTVAAVLQGEH